MSPNGLTTSVNTKLAPSDRAGLRPKFPLTTKLHTGPKHPVTTLLQKLKQTSLTSPQQKSKHHAVDHAKLVKQAQTLVGQTFFGTLMKQMRESPFRSELMDGGRGGQAFGAMYDQQLAERMSRGAGQNLVNSIVHRLEARASDVRQQVAQARRAA